MYLYVIKNTVSDTKYYGITTNPKQRWAVHKYCAKNGKKTKLYDAMRSYGIEAFVMEVIEEGSDEHIAQREIELIATEPHNYNLHRGGHIGYDVRTKEATAVQEWKARLKLGRAGRKPALGMKHTEKTKKICGQYGKLRWDLYGRYPKEVLDYKFIEANKKFGISKTHYYRLQKAATK